MPNPTPAPSTSADDGGAPALVIVGPTAGGKSELALAVAELLGQRGLRCELASADAFQVYRGLDVATAKPSAQERAAWAHHLIDIREPTERFTASEWLGLARAAVGSIAGRGGLAIVVGGTHLYAKAFLDGLMDGPEPDERVRASLRALGMEQLRAELERVDPAAAARIHPNDERRTVRALEVHRSTGVPISALQTQWSDGGRPAIAGSLVVGLDWPVDLINRRINARVRSMVERGLVEEVRGLWSAGRLGPTAREALGVKQLVEHFEGRCTLDEAIEQTKVQTRRFAKNQRTWLRRLRATHGGLWIDADEHPQQSWAQMVVEHAASHDRIGRLLPR